MSVTFTVTGRGQFPVDMLRYDCCWPQGPYDAIAISESHHYGEYHDKASDGVPRWTVTLNSKSPMTPTVGRWTSFGCTVEVQS